MRPRESPSGFTGSDNQQHFKQKKKRLSETVLGERYLPGEPGAQCPLPRAPWQGRAEGG